MSELIKERLEDGDESFAELRMRLEVAVSHFRDQMLLISPLSARAESDLMRYRSYIPDTEVPASLRHLASKLAMRFNMPAYLLLSAAYAYIHRPSWFSSSWLTDFAAYIAYRTQHSDGLFLLEADRNAYAWLLLQCFFEITRSESEIPIYSRWPTLILLRSLLSVSGNSYMALNEPDGCGFLDTPRAELLDKIRNLPSNVRRQYNGLFLYEQNCTEIDSNEWSNIFLDRFSIFQQEIAELLRTYEGQRGNVPSDIEIHPLHATSAPSPSQDEERIFDVFLCHNSNDKNFVREIALQLIRSGIKPWLDEWELRPGFSWQRMLQEEIPNIKSVAVFTGESGLGPWQTEELEAILRKFVKEALPVIPVLLPNAPSEPQIPLFLASRTYVDFRNKAPDPLQQLIWGITGKRIVRR